MGTPRVGRSRRPTYQRSFTERYRSVIIAGVALAAIGLIGAFVFAGASRAAYICTTKFDPAATPTPAASASPQPGYVQDIMGNTHVQPGDQVRYTFCPPASGNHYNVTGFGPITPRFYGVDDKTLPEGWIHNLEHGALVILYRGDSDGATPAGQTALKAFFDSFPNSPVCGIAPGTSQGPVIARFDDMTTPFAALVWGRVLPLQTLDTAAIIEFNSIYAERTNPEPLCPSPTPVATPAPSGSASPSASASATTSASASASPAASASASPAASPSATPAASPSATPAASPSPSASPS